MSYNITVVNVGKVNEDDLVYSSVPTESGGSRKVNISKMYYIANAGDLYGCSGIIPRTHVQQGVKWSGLVVGMEVCVQKNLNDILRLD